MHSVIFDVDGTLWDITGKAAHIWQQISRKYGASADHITAERLKQEFGKPLEAIGRSLFPDLPEETMLRITSESCSEEIPFLYQNPPKVFPGVRELFAALQEKGYPVYIVSNCQKGYIEAVLDTNDLGGYVNGHLCAGDTGLGKAETMLQLIRKTGAPDPVYVGDTSGDFIATKEAGLPFIFAAYGYGEVSSEDADAVIRTPLELLDVIDRV